MSQIDWIILFVTLSGIILYGVFQRRSKRSLEGYFLSDRDMPWYVILFSIMGTQASAITYLTGPGQAYTDGMRFVQYYFGLPLAMIVICIFFVPVFSRLQVITAYEFLEKRFDARTRSLTSLLFLISRGLSTGISIYAPSLVLSSLMGWNIYITNMVMGGVLIVYTMTGGARAVAHTQKLQMIIILATLVLVGFLSVKLLPVGKGFVHALRDAGEAGKLNIISTGMKDGAFDWQDKYNIWSGLIGGFFLALSYFGTDHSQVGRYLTAKSTRESKLGLLMNGLVKVPMQFGILLLGILIFAYYSNQKAPVFFDQTKVDKGLQTPKRDSLLAIEQSYQMALQAGSYGEASTYRLQYKEILGRAIPGDDVNDTNYIFLRFVKDHLPVGLIGILFAIIFLSAWGSIAAALNSLAACTVVDFHQRYFTGDKPVDAYRISQWYTLGWGIFCILVSMFAYNIGNSLIEAVNILGSLFYGVILGIFLVAFWIRYVKGEAVFIAAVVSEFIVIYIYNQNLVSFLWLNAIGAILVLLLATLIEMLSRLSAKQAAA